MSSPSGYSRVNDDAHHRHRSPLSGSDGGYSWMSYSHWRHEKDSSCAGLEGKKSSKCPIVLLRVSKGSLMPGPSLKSPDEQSLIDPA